MTATATNRITYEPAYEPSVLERLHRLPTSARSLFRQVLETLREADELGGPEEQGYLALMEAIIAEAVERRDYYRLTVG
jgi:hypothetical protein